MLGDNAATYEAELRQLVSLLRNKLQQIRSYYEAATAKHASEQQRDLLGRRAARASAFVQAEQVTPGVRFLVCICFHFQHA